MSTPTVYTILVAPKATVDRNVKSHSWQDFGSRTTKEWWIYISHNVADTHVRGNSLIQLMVLTQGKEMKAANSFEI